MTSLHKLSRGQDRSNYPFTFQERYGNDHNRQILEISVASPPNERTHYGHLLPWVIFVHGGAWCDPGEQDLTEYRKAFGLLFEADRKSHVRRPDLAVFASINYGLSPRPGDPSDEPSRQLVYPDHLRDLLKALRFLREHYHVGLDLGETSAWKTKLEDASSYPYIVVGHSCGATMLVQLAMRTLLPQKTVDGLGAGKYGFGEEMTAPLALGLVEGIYDIPRLVQEHEHIPYYRAFITNAFGKDEELWARASPISFDPSKAPIEGNELANIHVFHSPDDELVPFDQASAFCHALNRYYGNLRAEELEGKHDQIWQEGVQLAKIFEILGRSWSRMISMSPHGTVVT